MSRLAREIRRCDSVASDSKSFREMTDLAMTRSASCSPCAARSHAAARAWKKEILGAEPRRGNGARACQAPMW